MTLNRYEKQELCSFIGIEGQRNIRDKHVLIVGAGALGSASAEMLVRAGIGKLTLIDRDYVEWSNLQRQHLYTERDAMQMLPKAVAAKQRLQEINRDVQIESHVIDATVEQLAPFVETADVILDATDNFDIRFIVNDLAQKFRIPFIFAACVGSFGSTFTIIPGKTPCLQCLLKQMPLTGATCDREGIISPIIQLIVSYQVTECLKLLVEDEASLRMSYLSVDLWQNQQYSFQVDKAKNHECLSCGEQATYPYLAYEAQTKAAVLCGRNTVQLRPQPLQHVTLESLEYILKHHGITKRNPFLLSVDYAPYRLVFFKDGRVLIHGTSDIVEAKKIYYSLIG
ncbi:MAG: MoeB/ThiF family adenylyltransferase [Solibacillus sp.]